jgi:diacylglycerol kinase (ATP)
MVAKVILNPYAGRWKALKRKSELESALRAAEIDYDLIVTERPRHAIDLARQAALEGFNPIIAAGGDGTSNEVINGILQAASYDRRITDIAYGIMPMGSVNDLAVNLSLPIDLGNAARVIATGDVLRIDLGMLIDHTDDMERDHYFDNNSAVGLEPCITLIQERITRISGEVRYIAAAIIGILKKPEWIMHLLWDDGEYEGPISLVTIGNNPLTGGVFYMTPHADPFDGKLTFVYGYMPTRRSILLTLPKTMKPDSGNYVEHSAIHEIHTTRLRIKSKQPTPLHTDGEIQSKSALDLEYSILPARLPMLLDVTRLKSSNKA